MKMKKETIILGVAAAVGVGVAAAIYFREAAAAAAGGRFLTLNVSCDGSCVSGETVTFSGRLTENGRGVSGERIYIKNETTGELMGNALTDANGNYTITSTLPSVDEVTIFQFRAYTQDQL